MFLANGFSKIILEYGIAFLQGIGITLLLAISGTIIGLIIALIFGFIRVQVIEPQDSTIIKIIKKIGLFL